MIKNKVLDKSMGKKEAQHKNLAEASKKSKGCCTFLPSKCWKCCRKEDETAEQALMNFQESINLALEKAFFYEQDPTEKVTKTAGKVNDPKSEKLETKFSMLISERIDAYNKDFKFDLDLKEAKNEKAFETYLKDFKLKLNAKKSRIALSSSRGYIVQWDAKKVFLYQLLDAGVVEVKGFCPMKMEQDIQILYQNDSSGITFSGDERRLVIVTNKGLLITDNFDEPVPEAKIQEDKFAFFTNTIGRNAKRFPSKLIKEDEVHSRILMRKGEGMEEHSTQQLDAKLHKRRSIIDEEYRPSRKTIVLPSPDRDNTEKNSEIGDDDLEKEKLLPNKNPRKKVMGESSIENLNRELFEEMNLLNIDNPRETSGNRMLAEEAPLQLDGLIPKSRKGEKKKSYNQALTSSQENRKDWSLPPLQPKSVHVVRKVDLKNKDLNSSNQSSTVNPDSVKVTIDPMGYFYPYKLIAYDFSDLIQIRRFVFLSASFKDQAYGGNYRRSIEFVDPLPKYLLVTYQDSNSPAVEIIFCNIDNVLKSNINQSISDSGSKLSRENNYGVEVVKPGGYWGRDISSTIFKEAQESEACKIYYSSHYNAIYRVSVQEQSIYVEAFSDVVSRNYIDREKITKSSYKKKQINYKLFSSMKASTKGLILASEPAGKIYLLSFKHEDGMPLKEIITLPGKIKTINQITFDQKLSYIFMNADDGELYVWAKMRDKTYGMIYYSKLESEHTKLYVAHDCRFIFQATGDKLNALSFAPYTKPLVQSIDITSIIKVEGNENFNSKSFRCFRLGSKYTLSFNNNKLIITDIYTTETYIPKQIEPPAKSEVEIKVWPYKNSKSAWVVHLFFTNKGETIEKRQTTLAIYFVSISDEHIPKIKESGPSLDQLGKGSTQTEIEKRFVWRTLSRIEFTSTEVTLVCQSSTYCMFQCIDEKYTKFYEVFTIPVDDYLKKSNSKDGEIMTKSSYSLKHFDLLNKVAIVEGAKKLLTWNGSLTDEDKEEKTFETEKQKNFTKQSAKVEDKPDNALLDSYDELDVIDNGPTLKLSKLQMERRLKPTELLVYEIDSLVKYNPTQSNSEQPSSAEKTVSVLKVPISKNMNFLKISPDLKYFLFYGQGGYHLFSRNGNTFTSCKRKIHHKYKIGFFSQAEFSADSRYLIVSLPTASKVILFDLTQNPIKGEVLVNCNKLSDYRISFEFLYITNSPLKQLETKDFKSLASPIFVAVTDYSESLRSNKLRIFELKTKLMMNGGVFSSNLTPLYIDYRINDKKKLEYVTVDLTDWYTYGKSSFTEECDDRFMSGSSATINRICTYMHNTERIPFHYFLRTNFYKYFKSQDQHQSENFYFNLIINIYKTIQLDTMFSDPRLFYSLYILDRQGLIENVFGGRTYLSILFTHQKLLQLLFNNDVGIRHYSIESVVKLFEEYTKQNRFPTIDESFVTEIINSRNKNIKRNPGCRSILSFILFADCNLKISGLVANKRKSAVKLTPEEHAVPRMVKWMVEDKVRDILVENPNKLMEYQVYRTRVEIELTNGTEGSIGLFHAIMLMPDSEIRYKYRQLINLKWDMVFWYSFTYCFLYYVLNVLAYIYFGYNPDIGIGISVVIFNILFILFDIKCFFSQWRMFMKDLNNWLDISVHTVSIISVILLFFNAFITIHPFVRLIAISLISVRGITLLKMFGPLRMLILLIGEVIAHLYWIPFVLAAVLVLAATIYKIAPLPGGNTNSNLGFIQALQEVFFLIFMNNQADSETVSVGSSDTGAIIRSLIVVLGGVLLAQGIFNFIIAIFVQTFKKVNDDREIYEIRGMILDIRDVDLFLRGFSSWMKEVKGYYLFLVPIPKDGQIIENETEFDKATRMFDAMMAEVGKRGLKQLEKRAIETLPDHKDKIKSAMNALDSQAPKTDPTIKALIDSTEKLATKGEFDMDDVKNVAQAALAASSKYGKKMNRLLEEILVILAKVHDSDLAGNFSEKNVGDLLRLIQVICDIIFPKAKLSKEYIDTAIDIVECIPFKQLSNVNPEEIIDKLKPKLQKVIKDDNVNLALQLIELGIKIYFSAKDKIQDGSSLQESIKVFIKISKSTTEKLGDGSNNYLTYMGRTLDIADTVMDFKFKYNLTNGEVNKELLTISCQFGLDVIGCLPVKTQKDGENITSYLRAIQLLLEFVIKTIKAKESKRYKNLMVKDSSYLLEIDIKEAVESLKEVVKAIYIGKLPDKLIDNIVHAVAIVQTVLKEYQRGEKIEIQGLLEKTERAIKEWLPEDEQQVVDNVFQIIENVKGLVEEQINPKPDSSNKTEPQNQDGAQIEKKKVLTLEEQITSIIDLSNDTILKIFFKNEKKEDERKKEEITNAVKKANRIVLIILGAIKHIGDDFTEQDALEIIRSGANILNILNPKLHEFTSKATRCIEIVYDQHQMLKEKQISLEKTVNDVTELLTISIPSIEKEVKLVKKLTLIIASNLDSKMMKDSSSLTTVLRTMNCSQYVECLVDVAVAMKPEYKEYGTLALELVVLIETTVRDYNGSSDFSIRTLNNYVDTVGKMVILSNKKYEPYVSQARKVTRFLLNLIDQGEVSYETMVETVDTMLELFSNFSSRVVRLRPVIKNINWFFIEVIRMSTKEDEINVERLLTLAGNILLYFKPDSAVIVSKIIAVSKIVDIFIVEEKIFGAKYTINSAAESIGESISRLKGGEVVKVATIRSVRMITALGDAVIIIENKYERLVKNCILVIESIIQLKNSSGSLHQPALNGLISVCKVYSELDPKRAESMDLIMMIVDTIATESKSIANGAADIHSICRLAKLLISKYRRDLVDIIDETEKIANCVQQQISLIQHGKFPLLGDTLDSTKTLISNAYPNMASNYNVACRLFHILDLIIHKSQANDFSIDSLRLVVTETLTVIKLVRPVPPKFEDCIQAFFAEVEKRQHLFAMSKESFEVSPFLRTLLPFTAVLEPNTRTCIGATIDLLEAIEVYAETGDLPSASQSVHLSRVLLESILRIKPETQRFVSMLQPLLKTAEIMAGLTDKSSQDLRTEHLLDAAIDIFRIVKPEYIPNSMKVRPVFTLLDKQIKMHRRGAPMQAVELIEDIRDAAVIVSPSYAEKVRLVADVAVISTELCMSGVQDDFSPTRLLCPLIDLATLSLPERKADAEVVKSYLTVLESQIHRIVEGDTKNVFAVVRELHKLLTRVDPEMGEKLKDMPTVVDTCELSAAFMSDPSEEMLVETLKSAGTIYFRDPNTDSKKFKTLIQLITDILAIKYRGRSFTWKPESNIRYFFNIIKSLIQISNLNSEKRLMLENLLNVFEDLQLNIKGNQISLAHFVSNLKKVFECCGQPSLARDLESKYCYLLSILRKIATEKKLKYPAELMIGTSEDKVDCIELELKSPQEIYLKISDN